MPGSEREREAESLQLLYDPAILSLLDRRRAKQSRRSPTCKIQLSHALREELTLLARKILSGLDRNPRKERRGRDDKLKARMLSIKTASTPPSRTHLCYLRGLFYLLRKMSHCDVLSQYFNYGLTWDDMLHAVVNIYIYI